MAHNAGEEFDAAFARIDRTGPDRFDIYWMRHTGKWWRLHVGVTLAEALRSSRRTLSCTLSEHGGHRPAKSTAPERTFS
jgi:hypothetical protein